jgi:hypothetical protein
MSDNRWSRAFERKAQQNFLVTHSADAQVGTLLSLTQNNVSDYSPMILEDSPMMVRSHWVLPTLSREQISGPLRKKRVHFTLG